MLSLVNLLPNMLIRIHHSCHYPSEGPKRDLFDSKLTARLNLYQEGDLKA